MSQAASRKETLVSVIVPVYNTSATLERCLDSITGQTYDHLEIIAIDDGSTDHSLEILRSFAKRDQRLQVITQSNQGLSAARNAGIEVASGDFLTFVDSDDTIEPGMIEALLLQAQANHTNLAIASFAEIFSDGKRREFYQTTSSDGITLDRITCLIRMLCEDGFTMSVWGKLYARHLFEQARFPVGKLYEDVGTTYRLILQCDRVSFLPLALYNYYQSPDSIIHQTFTDSKLSLIELTDQMCDELTAQLVDLDQDYDQTPRQQHSPQDAAELLRLSDAIRKRRVHARLSILRQLAFTPHYRKNPYTREIVQYIREHENDILQNPLSTKRDRLAIYTLRLGLPAFRLAWKIYSLRS